MSRASAVVLAALFCSSLATAALAFAFPLLAFQRQASALTLGGGFAGYFAARMLVSPLAGRLCGRLGERSVLVISLAGMGLAPLLYLVRPGVESLAAVQCLLGLCAGAARPAGLALLAHEGSDFREQPGTPAVSRFAWAAMTSQASFFLGPLLGGALLAMGSMVAVALGAAVLDIVAATLVWLSVPRQRAQPEPAHAETAPAQPARRLASLYLAVFGRTLGIGVLAAFYPVLLAERLGGDPLRTGLLAACPGLAACLALPFTARLAERFSTRSLTLAGMLAAAAALGLLAAPRDGLGFAVLGLAMGAASAVSLPSSLAWAAGSGRGMAARLGWAQGAATGGFTLGPLLGAVLVRATWHVAPVFAAAGLLGAAACLPLAGGLESLGGSRRWLWRGAALGAAMALALVGAGLAVWQAGPSAPVSNQSDIYRYADTGLGTVLHLTLQAPDRATADHAAAAALARIRELQVELDMRSPTGAIARINQAAGQRAVQVEPETFGLLERALALSRASHGVFDVTIGAVTSTPFYFARLEQATAAARRQGLVDWKLVELDPAADTVRLPRPSMALDLGGIAKGYIVDQAVALLRNQGIAAGIVEAGGDFYAFGPRDWHVGIENPRGSGLIGQLAVREAGVCGSGDYARGVVDPASGVRRHHVLDPRSLDSSHAAAGVTVIAPSAELADGLATTLLILGPAEGLALLESAYPEAQALWVLEDGRLSASPDFPVLAPEKHPEPRP